MPSLGMGIALDLGMTNSAVSGGGSVGVVYLIDEAGNFIVDESGNKIPETGT